MVLDWACLLQWNNRKSKPHPAGTQGRLEKTPKAFERFWIVCEPRCAAYMKTDLVTLDWVSQSVGCLSWHYCLHSNKSLPIQHSPPHTKLNPPGSRCKPLNHRQTFRQFLHKVVALADSDCTNKMLSQSPHDAVEKDWKMRSTVVVSLPTEAMEQP